MFRILIFFSNKLDSSLCLCFESEIPKVEIWPGNEDYITKTYLYNFDPLKPHFYIVKLGFTGVYIIFLISAQKHRLWVLVRTASVKVFLFWL